MQKERPSEDDTRQPLTTFHNSFISSLLDGIMGGSSDIPRGNRPGEVPIAIGLCIGDLSLKLGEYGRLFMTSLGICVGLV
jgi:hypothetical protein